MVFYDHTSGLRIGEDTRASQPTSRRLVGVLGLPLVGGFPRIS